MGKAMGLLVNGVKQGIRILRGAALRKFRNVGMCAGSGPKVKESGGIGSVYSWKRRLRYSAITRIDCGINRKKKSRERGGEVSSKYRKKKEKSETESITKKDLLFGWKYGWLSGDPGGSLSDVIN